MGASRLRNAEAKANEGQARAHRVAGRFAPARYARYYAGGDGAARHPYPLNTYRGIAPSFRCRYGTGCGDWPNRVVEPEGVMKLLTVRF